MKNRVEKNSFMAEQLMLEENIYCVKSSANKLQNRIEIY